MTFEAQHEALRTRFNTVWGATTPIAWPNIDFKPPNRAPWVKFRILDKDANQASFGTPNNNFFRYVGVVQMIVFTPLGEGEKEALELVDLADTVYKNWSHSSGVRFLNPPRVQTVGEEADKWHQVNIIAPFSRDSLF